jgi:hypothetical protein
MNYACFGECDCRCGRADREFDAIAERELRTPLLLDDLCRRNIGWYCDRTITYHHLEMWNLKGRSGLYILWHKNDYCSEHEMFHMKALYVGKGMISARMLDHWSKKATADELLIYFTYAEMKNRLAKYVEQLILDIYDVPLNRSENRGRRTLCAHFSQGEVE